MATYIIREMVVISVSWKEFQKIDGRVWTRHPLTINICAAQFGHRRGTHFTHLAQGRPGSRIALSSLCAWKEPSHLVCSMSHPWLLPHLPFTTSTSYYSFTLPSITQEHAALSVPQEQLREHPVHHAHLQAPSVDNLRHQESLWRENLQSGGNPRTTTPTGKLVARIRATICKIVRRPEFIQTMF